MMQLFPHDRDFLRRCFLVAAIALGALTLIWFVWIAVRGLLLVFAACLVAVGLDGLARLVHTKIIGISRHVAVIATATAVAVLLGAAFVFGGMNVATQAPKLQRQIAHSIDNISVELRHNKFTRGLVGNSSDSQTSGGSSFGEHITGKLTSAATLTVSTLADMLVVIIIGLYLALEPDLYQSALIRMFPASRRRQVEELEGAIGEALRRWLVGRGLSMTVIGVFSSIGLWLIGVPFALSLGLLAGLLTFVPYLGAIVSSIPALLVAGLYGFHAVVYVGALYLGLHIVEGYMLVPLIQKRAVSMAPGFLLIVQVLGGTIAGVLGVTLATPIALVLAVALQLGYVRDILGQTPHLPGEKDFDQARE